MKRAHLEALLLDLDGTLLNEAGEIRPRNREALFAARECGVKVMIVTGRSTEGTVHVLEELELDFPAVTYNGAAVYCPVEERHIEERILANEVRRSSIEFARRGGHQIVVMRAGEKFARIPADPIEKEALIGLEGVNFVEEEALDIENAIRVTIFSKAHPSSDVLEQELERFIDRPVYLTHFPLNMLPEHRKSGLFVADVHPPCRGKAEALRFLAEEHGIAPERVVAVGDATNDLPMIEAAGVGVAMGHAVPEVQAVADRIIGTNETDAIAELVQELFPLVNGADRA